MFEMRVISRSSPHEQITDDLNYIHESTMSWLEWTILVCNLLDRYSLCEFQVAGFGQELWPVDVRTDLATTLEQIPKLIDQLIQLSGNCSLDFYEQGLEREVKFHWAKKQAEIVCTSRTLWQPSPTHILLSTQALRELFQLFLNDVKLAVQQLSPTLVNSLQYKALVHYIIQLDKSTVD